MARIGINGFGRIGRYLVRLMAERNEFPVGINARADNASLAHLFKYDSVHHTFKGTVGHDENGIIINGTHIAVTRCKPNEWQWKDYGVDLVVESMRGHNLARIFTTGSALPNTGIPGNIGGFSKERVLHAEAAGYMKNIRQIGDIVEKGEEIARIYEKMTEDGTFSGSYVSVEASISGIIRGLIREGYHFQKGFKIADIDPRESELANCFTISDKARSIGGSVLEAVCGYVNG